MRRQSRRIRTTERPRRSPAPALVAVVLVLGAGACSGAAPSSTAHGATQARLLPMSLHGMPLLAVTTGAEAAALIRRLHGEDMAAETSYVGRYEGGGAVATLYVSRFRDPLTADSLVGRMSRAIGSGNRTFAHHTEFHVGALTIHAVLGQGQANFFYARGGSVAWLAIDRAMARVGLADLLGVSLDRIPAGLELGGVEILPPPDSLYRRGLSPGEGPAATTPRTSRERGTSP